MVGLIRPLVILPDDVLRTLPSTDLVDILVHECAHAVCRHQLVALVQRVAGMLFWPHPLVHVLNRELARAREEVCDNYVLRRSAAPRYARTLLEVSQMLVGVSAKPTALGLLHCHWRLEDRVADLLDRRRKVMTGVNRLTAAALIGMFLLLALVIAGTRIVQAEPAADKAAPAASKVIETTVEKTTEKTTTIEKTTGEKTATPSAGAKESQKAAAIERRTVNKAIKDFPDKVDLSTPETALAAVCRRMARKDVWGAMELSWVKLDAKIIKDVERAFREDPNMPKDYSQRILDAEIVEVFTCEGDLATVVYRSRAADGGRYGTVNCGKISGIWKAYCFVSDFDSHECPFETLQAAEEDVEKKKDDNWRDFVKLRDAVRNGHPPVFGEKEKSQAAAMQRRTVNKAIKDFPEKVDLSTPETAFAAWIRSVARKDIPATVELSWVKIDAPSAKNMEQALASNAASYKDLGQQILNAQISQVLTFHDDCAVVICKSTTSGKYCYSGQPFGKINGMWKSLQVVVPLFPHMVSRNDTTVANQFEKKKDELWQKFVEIRNAVKSGKALVEKSKGLFPAPSAAVKEKYEQAMRQSWQLSIALDMPELEPQVVQYAVLDEDPVPAFTKQISVVQLSYRRDLTKADSEERKEQVRNSQMLVSWDFGFRKITADKLRVLTEHSSSEFGAPAVASGSRAGKKWIVTKTVYIEGKPVCWCIPVDLTIGNKTEITLNANNVFDLRAAYDKAMGAPLSALHKSTWQIAFSVDMPSTSLESVQHSLFDHDPVPAFIAQVKRSRSHVRERLDKAHTDVDKEQVNTVQMEVAWDLGFKEVTGDKVYLVKNALNSGSQMMSNGPAMGKKWIVSKIAHADGKPICWCIPVDVKTGELTDVCFSEKNAFDLRKAYDEAMREPSKPADKGN